MRETNIVISHFTLRRGLGASCDATPCMSTQRMHSDPGQAIATAKAMDTPYILSIGALTLPMSCCALLLLQKNRSPLFKQKSFIGEDLDTSSI